MELTDIIDEVFDAAERYTKEKIRSDHTILMHSLDIFFKKFKFDIQKPINDEIRRRIERLVEDESNYDKGFKEGIHCAKICARCKKRVVLTIHHILPRSLGGEDNPENLIGLCSECHDEIECLTDDLLKNDHHYTSDDLEGFILNGFPNE